LTIDVEATPPVATILSGSYSGKLEYFPQGTVTVTFRSGVSLTEGTATIVTDRGTETLTYSYANSLLTTTHSGGTNFGFTLSLNEAFCVVISHKTSFDDDYETLVLDRVNES
jgi:hypothetical protein